MLTDAAGSVTDRYDYEGFGGVVNREGTTANSYLYSGEQLDETFSAYYLRTRYLSIKSARFLTLDRFNGNHKIPLSLNKYLYAEDSPTTKADYNGTDAGVLGDKTLVGQMVAIGLIGILLMMQKDELALSRAFSRVWQRIQEPPPCPTSIAHPPELLRRPLLNSPIPGVDLVLSTGGPETGGGPNAECHVNVSVQSDPGRGLLNLNYHVTHDRRFFCKAAGTTEQSRRMVTSGRKCLGCSRSDKLYCSRSFCI